MQMIKDVIWLVVLSLLSSLMVLLIRLYLQSMELCLGDLSGWAILSLLLFVFMGFSAPFIAFAYFRRKL